MTLFFLFRGFCYFNSVAIAARLLRLRMSVEKVLVIDWVCLKWLKMEDVKSGFIIKEKRQANY